MYDELLQEIADELHSGEDVGTKVANQAIAQECANALVHMVNYPSSVWTRNGAITVKLRGNVGAGAGRKAHFIFDEVTFQNPPPLTIESVLAEAEREQGY
jgi:hypothetical protein